MLLPPCTPHALEQRPVVHDGEPKMVVHVVPHDPQLEVSDDRDVSQPSETLPLQLPHKVAHAMEQDPLVQEGTPCAEEQELPHAPQLATVLARSVSQPSDTLALQSPQPASHVSTVQEPLTQDGVAWFGSHRLGQLPQWLTSVCTLVSQPLPGIPSQSAQPPSQVKSQVPLAHVDVACGREGQLLPQAPQWLTAMSVWVSQPFDAFASQFPQPALQAARWQVLAMHSAEALAKMQGFPQ